MFGLKYYERIMVSARFFIGLLADSESDIESLDHCEPREVTPPCVSLLDDWVETLRENVDVHS